MRRGIDCLIQVCEGLAAAHAQGVIHRDIKPGNLFLTREGAGQDHGLRDRARADARPGSPRSGMIVGTPEYMSPEQIRGEAARRRSDLYALGVVAYEMFTGRKPFVHDDARSPPADAPHGAARSSRGSRPGTPARPGGGDPDAAGEGSRASAIPDARALAEALAAVPGPRTG